MSGCLHLGGVNRYGCNRTCDFYCSTNWRMETDDAGCPVWAYDLRRPAPGENNVCFPNRDAAAD